MSQTILDGLRSRFSNYASSAAARAWLADNRDRVHTLFSSPLLRDYVLGPFKEVFHLQGPITEPRVRCVITSVALANAVMASLPGKMGLGVGVSMALEGYMAWQIACHVGYRLQKSSDIWGIMGVAAGAVLGVLVLMKQALGVLFSLFNSVGLLPATFMTEFLATTLLGVTLWLGFKEGREQNRFRVPKRLLANASQITASTIKGQWKTLRAVISLETIKLVGGRLRSYFSGELVIERPRLRGDVYVPMAMGYVLARQSQALEGPLGKVFLASLYRTHPQLEGVPLAQVAEHMQALSPESLQGTLNLIRGDMFEQMVALQENTDDDAWQAVLHEDRNHPGSDITFVHEGSGDSIEVSLKATMDKGYIEEALRNYPDIPIQTTDEVAAMFESTGAVQASGITHEDLTDITEANFEELLGGLPALAEGVAAGVSIGAFVAIFPFLVARLRGRISQEQLKRAVMRVTGQAGSALIARLLLAASLGAVYGWYLLARISIRATEAADSHAQHLDAKRRRLVLYEGAWHGGFAAAH